MSPALRALLFVPIWRPLPTSLPNFEMPLSDVFLRPGVEITLNCDLSTIFEGLNVLNADEEDSTPNASNGEAEECKMRFKSLLPEEVSEILKYLDIQDMVRFERVNKDWFRLVQVAFLTVKKIGATDVEEFATNSSFDVIRLLNRCLKIEDLDFSILRARFGLCCLLCRISPKQLAWRFPFLEVISHFDNHKIFWLQNYVEALDGHSQIKRISIDFDLRGQDLYTHLVERDYEFHLENILSGCPKLLEMALSLVCDRASDDGYEVFGNLFSDRIGTLQNLNLRNQACFAIFHPLTTESHPGLKGIARNLPKSSYLASGLAEELVKFAPNLEKLVPVRTCFGFLNGLAELQNLKELEITLLPEQDWNVSDVKKNVEFFLSRRGKQLTKFYIVLQNSPEVDATNSLINYCGNLEYLLVVGLTINLTMMAPLTKLREYTFFTEHDVKTDDLEVLFQTNRKLRVVEIFSSKTSMIGRLQKYFEDTAVRRKEKYPKLRVAAIDA